MHDGQRSEVYRHIVLGAGATILTRWRAPGGREALEYFVGSILGDCRKNRAGAGRQLRNDAAAIEIGQAICKASLTNDFSQLRTTITLIISD